MKINAPLLIAAIVATTTPYTTAAEFTKTSFEIGYMGFSDTTKDDNPGALDQPFMSFNHIAVKAEQSLFQMIKLENPDNIAGDKRMATKALTIFHHDLGNSAFQFWGQNFLVAHKDIVEDNIYLGAKHKAAFGGVKLKYGVGIHYTHSSSDFKNLDYTGFSGGVGNINMSFRDTLLDWPTLFSLDYTTQFARDEEHAAVFNYDEDYGHQIIASMATNLSDDVFIKANLKHYKSWGCTPNDGVEYGFSIGYVF
ncbi:porin [Ferrimonas lipolytica]|uniref:Porin n=1 Tax=Ferrimonas lipolytica TaxID=2724191 RepID=A0A6H1UEY5_9GAMM|nr:porin [Ferrimonas lipolytica]QIZ77604.1 porin [Ferrimonas lipolytica]